MAISRVKINDFLVFKGNFEAKFCSGVNVIIGGNGTGKTTVMKVMYASKDIAGNRPFALESVNLGEYFNTTMMMKVFDDWSNVRFFNNDIFYKSEEEIGFETNDDYYEGLNNLDPQIVVECNGGYSDTVFIPSMEILSHAKGLLALYHDREISFDKTEINLLVKAEKGAKREVSNLANRILSKLSSIMGGEIVYKNGDFFVDRKGIGEIKFSLEASGYRKLGLLWKLLRNGIFEKDSILFWDELENSLNPEIVPVLVDILLELTQSGVQIFIATHDYNLARYFDVRKNKDIPVMFHNFSKDNDGQISCVSSGEYMKIPNNLMETTGAALFKAVASDALGVEDDD